MEEIEIKIDEEGNLKSIYKDELRPLYKALGGILSVGRASDVEWEDIEWVGQGWTVRSHKNPKRALRHKKKMFKRAIIVSEEGPIVFFNSREDALACEVKHFWELIGEDNGRKDSL